MGKPLIDLAGGRFGLWSVLSYAGSEPGRGSARWKCVCDCGTERIVTGISLRSGKSTSCGCQTGPRTAKRNFTHGLSGTRIHRIWKNMRARCTRAAHPDFKRYGARGISICTEWSEFKAFHKWAMETGYNDMLSIERLDVDKGYHPDNCIWIPMSHQSFNRSCVARRDDGVLWAHVADENGVGSRNYHSRLACGWSPERAATQPLDPAKRKTAG